jgi:hypothetical protein
MVPLVDVPRGFDAEIVECPTCGSFTRWGCGAPTAPGACSQRADGYHRTRVLAALRRAGRVVRCVRKLAGDSSFFWDVRERCYYDRIPGYKTMFVARVGATPLLG